MRGYYLLAIFFLMHISDYFVQDLPLEVESADLSLFRYKSFSAIKAPALELARRYPKEVSTLRFLNGLQSAVDFEILLEGDGISSLWSLYLEDGVRGVASALDVCFNTANRLSQRFGFQDGEHTHLRKMYRRYGVLGPNPFLEESGLMWYLFGFVLGDGCIECKWSRGHSFKTDFRRGDLSSLDYAATSLVLSSTDFDFLNGFRSFFPQGVISNPVKGCYSLRVWDRGVCDTLFKLGIYPRKSYNPTVLPDISKEFYPYFILGLMDSDGWVTPTNKGRRLRFGLCGHTSYIEQIYYRLQSYCPSVRYTINPKGLGIISIYRTSELVELFNCMYCDAPYYLERKHTVVKRILGKYGFKY